MSYSPLFRGNTAQVGSSNLVSGYQNGSGSTLLQCTPVSTNTLGQMIAIDVSDANSVSRLLGLVSSDTPQAAKGAVVDGGRLQDISINFNVGDVLYVSKAGFLTSTVPDLGSNGFVAGDSVIFVGVVVKNEFDASLKDLKLLLSVIGQL